MAFKIESHTADVRILASGKDMNELYYSALEGLVYILKPEFEPKSNDLIKELIEIESEDRTTLLIDFLAECLYIMHSKKVLISDVDFKILENMNLQASVTAERIDGFDVDVKAITYHEADIKWDIAGFYTTVIVPDI